MPGSHEHACGRAGFVRPVLAEPNHPQTEGLRLPTRSDGVQARAAAQVKIASVSA